MSYSKPLPLVLVVVVVVVVGLKVLVLFLYCMALASGESDDEGVRKCVMNSLYRYDWSTRERLLLREFMAVGCGRVGVWACGRVGEKKPNAVRCGE